MATKPTETKVKPKDVSAWKKAGEHDVNLGSGAVVTIRLPNLPQMIKTGEIPNDLLDAALGAIQKERITPELMKEQADFFNLLVSRTVIDPVVTPEEVPGLPYEDIELLVELATRQRDVDFIGHNLGGYHLSDDWRKFRGLDSGDENVEGF